MKKVIRDGKVAVLVSPGYGAGWYSWNTEHEELLFHPKIVEMVESGKTGEIDDEWIEENIGIKYCYYGGARDLCIHWVPIGEKFEIEEYDGSEVVRTVSYLTHTA